MDSLARYHASFFKTCLVLLCHKSSFCACAAATRALVQTGDERIAQPMAQVVIELSTCRCAPARRDCRWGCNPGGRQALGVRGSLFVADWFVSNESLSHEEPVGRDAQAGVW